MIIIKDYENEFTVLQSDKAMELIRGLIEASEPTEDLLKEIDLSDLPKFDGIATTKEGKVKKKELEDKYELELTKRLLEKHGMIKLLRSQTVNNLKKVNPIFLAKFGALLYKTHEKEVFSDEVYEKRLKEFMTFSIKKINELKVREEIESFLSDGISGIVNTFQISTAVKV